MVALNFFYKNSFIRLKVSISFHRVLNTIKVLDGKKVNSLRNSKTDHLTDSMDDLFDQTAKDSSLFSLA